MLDSAVNTYTKGLNRDVSKTKYSNDTYYDGLNIRVITDEALSSFSITNEKGNSLRFCIPTTYAVYKITFDPSVGVGDAMPPPPPSAGVIVTINGVSKTLGSSTSVWSYDLLYSKLVAASGFGTWIGLNHYVIYNNIDHILIVGLNQTLTISPAQSLIVTQIVPTLNGHKVVGSTQVRDSLILFTKGATGEPDALLSGASNGQLWKLTINPDGTVQNIGASNYLVHSEHLIYNQTLNFSTVFRIEAYGNYETPEIGKVYWTDNYNNFRHFNVLATNPLATRLSAVEIILEVIFGDITIDSVTDGGTYQSGMVQYSYQYYNLHGSQSSFALPTGLVHLTSSSESLPSTQNYLGSAKDEQTGKAITITISDLDRTFTNLRIIALYYETLSGTPEIRIVNERQMPSSGSVTFVDAGDVTKGLISSVEFTSIGSVNFKCKTFTTKDNILFPANITEEFYDVDADEYWDSRAYRFSSTTGYARLGDSTTGYVNVEKSGDSFYLQGTTTIVPETHDCIQTKSSQGSYRYLPDSSRLGGEGPNVKYYFKLQSFIEDSSGITGSANSRFFAPNSDGFTNFANPLEQANYVGYQRDEVYRFGIVFRDERGRKSFVKWVADIKMPAINENDLVTTYWNGGVSKTDFNIVYTNSNGTTMGNTLHLIFELKNGLPNDAVSWEVVRLKREKHNRTIRSQGILFKVNTAGDDLYYAPHAYSSASVLVGASGVIFASPEAVINKESFDSCGVQPLLSYDHDAYDNTYGAVLPADTYKTRKLHSPSTNSTISGTTYSITDSRIVPVGYTATYSIIGFNKPYRHYRYDLTPDPWGYAGTACVMSLGTVISSSSIISGSDILVVNIVKTLDSQYGGNTYSSRFANEYISCGQLITENVFNTFGGDTYIGYFDYLWGIFDLAASLGGGGINSCYPIYFPVETTINLALRHDISQVHVSSGEGSHLMQETAGSHAEGDFAFSQATDLYLYNLVYSRENDVSKFFSKPLDFSNNQIFDVRILSSEPKIINEEADSWLLYLATNYTDVDGTYGGINNIKTFKNRVVFLQDRAIGWATVNERSLITPDATGTSLSLGKGGILDQYFYLSRHAGATHQFGVVDTPNGLYYYDSVNNRINVFTGETNTPISEVKGLSSYLKQLSLDDIKTTDTTLDAIGVHSVYDSRFNRVLWTFKDLNSPYEFTVSYNEILQAFESFYSFKPVVYLTFNDKLYSMSPTDPTAGYLHNVGNYGQFYRSYYDSYIEVLMNKDPYRIKLPTNLEYYLNTYPDNLYNFSRIRIYNDYQDTGEIVLDSTNSGRRMRTYRFTIPRNTINNSTTDRIRGEYCLERLIFDNERDPNVKFVLSDLITHYIPKTL